MIRVMIVATYIEVREGLSTVLRLAGDIQITCAASLNSAVGIVRETEPDAVIIDLEMAQGEGWKALWQLKRQCPAMRIIALTARETPAARESALQAGADTVLVKGVGVAEMVEAIAGS